MTTVAPTKYRKIIHAMTPKARESPIIFRGRKISSEDLLKSEKEEEKEKVEDKEEDKEEEEEVGGDGGDGGDGGEDYMSVQSSSRRVQSGVVARRSREGSLLTSFLSADAIS